MALEKLLSRWPKNAPPTCIVQHIAGEFLDSFVEYLSEVTECDIKVISDRVPLKEGTIYFAPAEKHMELLQLEKGKGTLYTQPNDGDPYKTHKPSINVLLDSAKNILQKHSVAVGLLSGMGDDGANAAKEIKDLGGYCIGQNKETSAIYGISKRAKEMGATHEEGDLKKLGENLFKGKLRLKVLEKEMGKAS